MRSTYLLFLTALASPAFAADDTIVVTANRTPTPLNRVGQSISVLDAIERLRRAIGGNDDGVIGERRPRKTEKKQKSRAHGKPPWWTNGGRPRQRHSLADLRTGKPLHARHLLRCRPREVTLDHPEHPVRTKDRPRQAGLLAPGSRQSPRLPGRFTQPVARWDDRSPVTVAGTAPDYRSTLQRPGSLLFPVKETCRAAPIGAIEPCRKRQCSNA